MTSREMNGEDELRILLIGMTGVGKSSVGNLILGEEVFKTACSPVPETQICERKEKVINGIKIVVIDTPGINDTSQKKQSLEIISCLVECAPGPHVIIVVLEVARQTREKQQAVEKMLKYFTGDVVNYTVLLFTHGCDLAENMTIHDFIYMQEETQTLKDLAEKCGDRVHVIDNKHWNENSIDSAVLATLQRLNFKHSTNEITERMQNTSAEQTPWFNILSDQADNAEEEQTEEQTNYRTNRFQLIQMMKRIKGILTAYNGQFYSDDNLEEAVKVINVELENIRSEPGVDKEAVDMVEIRRRAKETLETKIKTVKYSGLAIEMLLQMFLGVVVGVAAPFVLVAGGIRKLLSMATHQHPQAGGPPAHAEGPPVQKAAKGAAETGVGVAAVAAGAAAGAAMQGATGLGGFQPLDGGFLSYGAGVGGASGYKGFKMSDNTKQAAVKVAKAVVQTAGDVLKVCWNVGNTDSGVEAVLEHDQKQ